ncbi:hypothetical protein [Endothiovibrio diazotrophicus]
MNTILSMLGGGLAETATAAAARNHTTPAAGKVETTTGTNETTDATAASSQVELSTRAQKIRLLNEEFFPGGPSTVQISPAFVERLQEYGLISGADAKRLGADLEDTQPEGTLGDISTFIDGFVDKLTEENPDDGFIDTLKSAQSLIDHFDDPRSADSGTAIPTLSAQINQYLASDRGQSLDEQETHALKQLNLALTIADKMTPATRSSQKINQYLAFAS